jgi:hypothetical protein
MKNDQNRYGLLLALLITSFVVSGVDGSALVRVLGGVLIIAMLMLSLFSSEHGMRRHFGSVLMFVAIAGTIAMGTTESEDLGGAFGAAALVVVLASVTLAVIRDILSHRSVTNQTLLGALSAYFLIGQFFAWIYVALPGFTDDAVLAPVDSAGVSQYYSYVVLTTLGFGDVTPVGTFAERVTVMEALSGQLFLAILVARLVSMYQRQDRVSDAAD